MKREKRTTKRSRKLAAIVAREDAEYALLWEHARCWPHRRHAYMYFRIMGEWPPPPTEEQLLAVAKNVRDSALLREKG